MEAMVKGRDVKKGVRKARGTEKAVRAGILRRV